MQVQKLAQSALLQFTTSVRSSTGYEFYKTRDNCPVWIKDFIYTAHEGMLPDDYKYQFIYDALYLISESEDIDDLEQVEPDIYHGNLLNWLSSKNDRSSYCDRYYAEYSDDTVKPDLMTQIGFGQWLERTEVLESVLGSLQEILI